MASWLELPDPHAGDDLAYADAWAERISDEPETEEDDEDADD